MSSVKYYQQLCLSVIEQDMLPPKEYANCVALKADNPCLPYRPQ